MSWVYGHFIFLILSVRGPTLDVRFWRLKTVTALKRNSIWLPSTSRIEVGNSDKRSTIAGAFPVRKRSFLSRSYASSHVLDMSKHTLRTTYVIKLFLRSSYWVCWHSQTFVQHPYEKRTNSTAIVRRKSHNIIKSVSRVFLSRSHVNPTTMGFLGGRRHERDTKTCPFDCLEKLVKMFLKYLV